LGGAGGRRQGEVGGLWGTNKGSTAVRQSFEEEEKGTMKGKNWKVEDEKLPV